MRVVLEDPSLPHQIMLLLQNGNYHIALSCNCLRRNGSGPRGSYTPIEVRRQWEAADAIAVWREHVRKAEAEAEQIPGQMALDEAGR